MGPASEAQVLDRRQPAERPGLDVIILEGVAGIAAATVVRESATTSIAAIYLALHLGSRHPPYRQRR
jgi:hypothetical protein